MISQLTREDVIKPTPEELGIDPAALAWERSGDGDGSIEVAFPLSSRWARGDWVLMRVAGDRAAAGPGVRQERMGVLYRRRQERRVR